MDACCKAGGRWLARMEEVKRQLAAPATCALEAVKADCEGRQMALYDDGCGAGR